ncbi:hypothetical protein SAMN05444394_1393 [Algoriphagus halophilus]|uniref:Uncharacterized protein n=1 Tax=Algoriphagus halophilus TaxID=226505 RepID=A0A1N6DU08_9BACT|nr:hypothetical protein SAMN05444394_1393 [Algoriphagus halophilus]
MLTAEVYSITTITTHLRISKGKDFTTKAAISTATMPGIAMAIPAFLLKAPSRINRIDAAGIW